MLKTRRRSATRCAFLADFVIAIGSDTTRFRDETQPRYDSEMIGYIEGVVKGRLPGQALILVGGIGYKVAVTKQTLSNFTIGETAALSTRLIVREDALDLYGFQEEDELRLFDLLLTVSGIGPKSALAILDIASVETLRSAIAHGKSEYLTKVSGIGRKTAEKIIVELRDKVGAAAGLDIALKGDEDALEAMKSLGYSAQEARDALRKVPSTVQKSSDRLREALKILGS